MRALKIVGIAGIVLVLAAVLGVGYVLFLRPLTLPVYHLDQRTTGNPSFTTITLSIGDQVYINGSTEFPLEMTTGWVGKQAMVGRTQDGMEVYAIPQQDPRNYLMLTTEMFPNVIFRNNRIPPVQPSSSHFDALQVQIPGTGRWETTRDPAILREVIDCLTQKKDMIKSTPAINSYRTRLLSDALPGLGYLLDSSIDAGGKVYMMERLAPEVWIPAGPLFTKWFEEGK